MLKYKNEKNGKTFFINKIQLKDKIYPTCLLIEFFVSINNKTIRRFEMTRDEWSHIGNIDVSQAMDDFIEAEEEFKRCDNINNIKNKASLKLLNKVDKYLSKNI